MKTFKLEEYLTKYEFSSPYLLCCSDAESWSIHDLLQLAKDDTLALWNNLSLVYTEPYGHPALRQEITRTIYPELSDENVLCFAGAEEGIYAALSVICGREDHVIVFTPCYQSLLEVPLSNGSQVSQISLSENNNWRVDLEELKCAIQPNTKCIIINFPHNPTGQVIRESELKQLIELCGNQGIWLFSDEVYRLLGTPQEGWAPPASCLYDKALSLGVMSKAFGMAGLRIGWVACKNKKMLHKLKKFKDYLSICNSAPAEIISLIALQNKDYILARNNKIVSENLMLLDLFITEYSDRFSWVRPQGGCVGFVNYKGKEHIDNFCERLVQDKGVLLLPASIYDLDSKHFRIGFGRKNMPDALQKLMEFLKPSKA